MHNIEERHGQLHTIRSMESLRQAIGQSWPTGQDAEWESSGYTATAAPKGGMTYTAKNLGL